MNRKIFVFVALALAAVFSCTQKKTVSEPDANVYSHYVKAYSAGVLGPEANIVVELAQEAASRPTVGLFSFSPELKGTVSWESGTLVRFKPDELVPGQTYTASFALSKVMAAGTGAPEQFPFGFSVRKSMVETVEAPAESDAKTADAFRVKSVNLSDSKIDLVFSAPPVNAAGQGMVELKGVTRSYVQVQDTLVTVYFEGRTADLLLTVDKGVKNAKGEKLGEDFTRIFKADLEKPAVELLVSGNIIPGQNVMLPFKAVNLSSVEVRIVKIYQNNVLMFLQDNDLNESSQLRRSGRLVYKADVPLEAEDLHKWNTHCLDLSKLFNKEPGAIYSIRFSFRQDQSLYGGKEPLRTTGNLSGVPSKEDQAVWDKQESWYWDNYYDWTNYNWKEADNPETPSYYMDASRFPGVMLLSSDIGLMAASSGGNELWLVATDLLTARPLAGATLDVFDYQLQNIASAKTGSDGLAKVKVARKPFAVVGRSGGGYGYLKLSGERSVSRFDVGGQVLQEGLKAFIYGERGVWRPGDTLHVTAIVQDKGRSLPDGHPATLEVYTPEGQFYSKLVRKSTDGFFSFDIPTRDSDPTGYWNADLKVGGVSFHKTLHIETVKPNRLKITTSLEDEKMLKAGKDITVTTSARWLSGGLAGNCPARAVLTLKKSGGNPFKGFEKYTFTNPSNRFSAAESVLYDKKLSPEGVLTASVKLPEAKNAPGMMQAMIVTSVQETGGDESFTTVTLPFSPYSSYVGVCVPEDEYLETDKDHTFKVAVLDADGRRVKNHKIEYAIFKTGWNWWWDNPGTDLDTWISGSSVQKISEGSFTSGSEDGKIPFRIDYPDWGRFLVLVRDRVSGHVCSQTFLADWPEYRGRADRRDPEALTMLTFSTDKDSYEVGQTATVYIPAAKEAQALVSIENSMGVLDRKWVATSEKETPFTFTVTPEMAPNFYLNITLIQPYGAVENDLPLRMYGIKRIIVENPGSHLKPIVKLPDVIRPEEKFTVEVSEKNGKPMTYTLAIVDEGLLDLTAFKTPNPWAHMYKPEALGVKTWDLFDNVVGAWSGRFASISSIGGDEDALVSARKDNRFNPVVLYQAPRTLKAGTDKLELQLPMYVGSVRVMVVAGHEGAYGSADQTVPVRSPLMVVTTLPRALGQGEEVAVPVNVFAMEDGLKEATVSIKAEGPVELVGQTTQKLSFDSAGDKLVHFGLRAAKADGTARITVVAGGGGHKTHETIALQVSDPNPEVTDVKRYTVKAGDKTKVEDGYSVRINAFPALDVHSIFTEMKGYPYSCAEQLAAKGITFLYLLPQLGEEDAQQARELIPEIINTLYTRQNSDGGFAYWNGGPSASWVTSMAGLFLSEASKAGFSVNKGVLNSWERYQNKMSSAFRVGGTSIFSDLDQAFRLYSQTAAGFDPIGAMNRLREAQSLSDKASWMLAATYALSGRQKNAVTLIENSSRKFSDYDADGLTYGSSLRDKMIALDALALAGKVEDAIDLAKDYLPTGGLTTQETAFASIAFAHLFEKIPTKDFKASVDNGVVRNDSDGPIYVTASKTSRRAITEPISNGIEVKVAYLNEAGEEINPSTLKQGTRFRAVVKVTNLLHGRDLSNIALSFGVPSGWEIVNDRLLGTADEGYDFKDVRDLRVDWFFSLHARRFRTFTVQLRAAYEGTFTLPATTASAMYDPKLSGAAAGGTVTVSR